MKPPFRGRFGARDNSHAMLEWNGPKPVPVELLGLTDKPPGSYGPGDRWWPAVGCGPVGDLWAIWWTVPDETAARGGMARSEVAAWPVADAGSVDDLRGVLLELSGLEVSAAASELTAVLAEALLEPPPGRTVFVGLDLWPSVVVALWERLWPAARRSFSARAAVSPPQAPESVAPPWLFGIPLERVPQWTGWRLVSSATAPTTPSRAAKWLAGTADASLGEVLAGLDMGSDLSGLRRAARAAEKIDAWRAHPDGQRALETLRSLLAVAPGASQLAELKARAIRGIEVGLTEAQPALVFGLANIDLALVQPPGDVAGAVRRWVRVHAPSLEDEDIVRCLSMLSPGRTEEWWATAVGDILRAGLSDPDARWGAAALRWLSGPVEGELLEGVLPRSVRIEDRLLAVAETTKFAAPALERLRGEAARRGWSRLHAWALSCAYSVTEALTQQRTFRGDSLPGLAYLVDRLPGEAVAAEAARCRAAALVKLVADRTVREPHLLRGLDATIEGWRSLWAAHIAAGGPAWPPGVDVASTAATLLGLSLEGVDVDGLLGILARDLGGVAAAHPRRADLWTSLRPPARGSLLDAVAKDIVVRVERGESVEAPEGALSEAILAVLQQDTPSPRVAISALHWGLPLDEGQFVTWLRARRASEWAAYSAALGGAVLGRRWGRAARAIYDLARGSSELVPVAIAVAELLPPWDRFWLSWRTGGTPDTQVLCERVGSLAAELLPDQLDEVWERAGGSRRKLPYGTNPEDRWRAAVRFADQGGLDGGVECLLRELRQELPHNAGLRELEEMLSAARRR
ncbi:MAG: effector-associated domain EAD1-containing protein [Pseudomonadota bacterium]|nr:effector-associated domain EAD1-containing protein [Pseudomonadota bacterium]